MFFGWDRREKEKWNHKAQFLITFTSVCQGWFQSPLYHGSIFWRSFKPCLDISKVVLDINWVVQLRRFWRVEKKKINISQSLQSFKINLEVTKMYQHFLHRKLSHVFMLSMKRSLYGSPGWVSSILKLWLAHSFMHRQYSFTSTKSNRTKNHGT